MSGEGLAGGTMARVAATLGRRARRRKPSSRPGRSTPHLWFLTDPARIPDPTRAILALPRGAVVVYRAFGAADRLAVARKLRHITRGRGLKLLIGLDWRLAAAVGADGVHLPQRWMSMGTDLRRRRPHWLISAAAHDRAAIIAGNRLGLDALLVSAVFPSRSPSASRALGTVRFAAMVGGSRVSVIALGGVNAATAPRLRSSGAAGLAGVEALSRP